MTRLRITAALAAAAILLTLATPAAATPSASETVVAQTSAATVGSAVDAPSERASARQLRRTLPSRNSLGPGVRSERFFANAWCGATQIAGPVASASAGALYTDGRTFEFGVMTEAQRSVRAAKQRFRAVSRQIRQACPGFVVIGNELVPQRAAPLRRIGQQSAGIGFRLRNQTSGQFVGDFNFSVHRTGRFVTVVLANAPRVEPRDYQRAMRQIESRLRRL